MKKVLSAVLLLCVVLSVIAVPVSALAEKNWAMGYVDFCVNQGLFRDKTRTSITETQKTKRQEVAYALMKIEGDNVSNNIPPIFSDVAEASYYNGAIIWAYQSGIMNGTGNGQFNPSGYITKQDLAVAIYRYLLSFSVNRGNFKANNGTLTPAARDTYLSKYPDASSISSYARDAVYELSIIGLITGNDAGYFTPTAEIPLIEATCMLTRAHGYRYNDIDTINVYVRSYTGSSFNNVAVTYLRLGSATSYSTNDMQIKITSNGIASLLSDGNGSLDAHYVNAMSQYTSTFLSTPCSPSPFYKFITIPRNEADYPLTPAYDRYNMYKHNNPRQCVEPSWAFPQWCPTQLIHSGQNFGWRYNGGVEFHQGMDYGCSYETIYNTTDYQLKVISCGNDVNDWNPDTKTENELGYYVKVQVLGTDKFLIYQHLDSYSVYVGQIINAKSTDVIAVTGESGAGGLHLHLTMTDKGGHVYYPCASAGYGSFFDPRIYFK